MAGSVKQGLKAQATIVAKRGMDGAHQFRAEIGRKGGIQPYIGKKGFAAHPELAVEAGRKGLETRLKRLQERADK